MKLNLKNIQKIFTNKRINKSKSRLEIYLSGMTKKFLTITATNSEKDFRNIFEELNLLEKYEDTLQETNFFSLTNQNFLKMDLKGYYLLTYTMTHH